MNEYREGLVITASELKLNLGKYLGVVMDKNDVVITKNNKKIARLTPYVTDIEAYFTVKEKAHDYVYGGKKVSYSEFMQISENSTERMEFINGEIFLLSSPTSFHQDTLGYLYILFNRYFKNKPCKVYLAPFDVHFYKKDISTPDVMQPDITVACDYKTTINEKGKYIVQICGYCSSILFFHEDVKYADIIFGVLFRKDNFYFLIQYIYFFNGIGFDFFVFQKNTSCNYYTVIL